MRAGGGGEGPSPGRTTMHWPTRESNSALLLALLLLLEAVRKGEREKRPLTCSLVVAGCGAAWLARLTGGQEVPGSNPGSPTTRENSGFYWGIPANTRAMAQSAEGSHWRANRRVSRLRDHPFCSRGLSGPRPDVEAVRGLGGIVFRRVRAWNCGRSLAGAGGEGAGQAAAARRCRASRTPFAGGNRPCSG